MYVHVGLLCVTDGEEGTNDLARKGGGESQGFVAIKADSASPLGEEEEEVEGEEREEEMEGEGEEDKLSQLPESMREILVSLLQEKYECTPFNVPVYFVFTKSSARLYIIHVCALCREIHS